METLFQKPVTGLQGVGPKRAALYEKLGIRTVGDLLSFFPRQYLDFTKPVPICETVLGEQQVVQATVFRKQGEQRLKKGLSVFKVFVSDGFSTLTVTIFNAKYLFESLEIGETYYFYGKVTGSATRREMQSPRVLQAEEGGRLWPLYPLTEGLTNKQLTTNVKQAMALLGDGITDFLPPAFRQRHRLCYRRYAIETLHFPTDPEALQTARRRLVFEELFLLRLRLLGIRQKNRGETAHVLPPVSLEPFYRALPFTLTEGQQTAIREALADMQKPTPMRRLLQGDVGSGKTMVAAALFYACCQVGMQAALMVPTQILAAQHANTLQKTLAPFGITCGLLTAAMTQKERTALLQKIATGECQLVVGTHAVLGEQVKFHRLGLVVTDEQHRFGVEQRQALTKKSESPHMLVMSATPIPRTLALLFYGDLSLSVLRELPKGRQPVETLVIDSGKRTRALRFIKEQLDAGRQAYIVCPLIEDELSNMASAEIYLKELQKTPLHENTMAVLHGKCTPAQKKTLMEDFAKGEIQLLISTTVVEVGMDVPNASVMLVENAERFGLSQLHQLRGRVGRGSSKSYCILLSDAGGEDTVRRLEVMKTTHDGFVIAEEDLKLRGPGDFFGLRQHGLPSLRLADWSDPEILQETGEAVHTLLTEDPELSMPEHRELRRLRDNPESFF